jgi:hypothetical protein
MTTPELLGFIRSEFAKGRSKDAIHADLVSGGGWKEEDLEEAFHIVPPPAPKPAPAPVPTPAPILEPVAVASPVFQEVIQPVAESAPIITPAVTVNVSVTPPMEPAETMPSVMDQVAQAHPHSFEQVMEPVTPPIQVVIPPVVQPVAPEPVMQPGFQTFTPPAYAQPVAQVTIQPIAQPLSQPSAQPVVETSVHYAKRGIILLIISTIMVLIGAFTYAPIATILAGYASKTPLFMIAVYVTAIYGVSLLISISLFHFLTKLFALQDRSFGRATFIISLNVLMSVLITVLAATFHLSGLVFLVLVLLVIVIQMIAISRAYKTSIGKAFVVIITGTVIVVVIIGGIAYTAKNSISGGTQSATLIPPLNSGTTTTNVMQ